jgi:hypothetical protein
MHQLHIVADSAVVAQPEAHFAPQPVMHAMHQVDPWMQQHVLFVVHCMHRAACGVICMLSSSPAGASCFRGSHTAELLYVW